MAQRLKSKTALIFGAGTSASGIGNGAAIAIRMAEQGALVIAADKDLQAVLRTQSYIQGTGGRCEVMMADVCEENQIREATRFALDINGRVDVLVNNVGIVTLGGPEDIDAEDWDRAFEINVRSAFLTCKHVLPGMREARGGAIVNVSSLASIRWGGTPFCAYTASKAALNAFGQSVAMQYAALGIRCNTILLGLIDSPLVREQLVTSDPAGIAHLLAARNAMCPTGAMGTPWDAAEAAVFLASDEARYINGVELVVDGGLRNQVAAPQPQQKEKVSEDNQ
jgi:NAD(P)-dependent dehydrogenase (short-subunit alcohol dehydrogenase family)